ncbi:MAG: Ig-like domain-containing protein [Deltaproteobacteria bacterium]|nr:Ig-like domain-containing protein [Deltaproteobacteria bacterium]
MKKIFLALFLLSLVGCGRDQQGLEEASPDESPAPAADDQSATEDWVAALELALLSSPSSGGSGLIQLVVNVTFSNQDRKEGVTYRLLDPKSKKLTQILWESSNKTVAHISERGLLTPVSPGETLVKATLRGKTATAYLSIQGKTGETSHASASEELNVDVQLNVDPEDYEVSAAPADAGASAPSVPDNNACDPLTSDLDPFADRVVEYRVGLEGGFHRELLPDIVLGPPHAHPTAPLNGSSDVVSLGGEGEIVLEFTDYTICDGEGDDFIVFENPWQYDPDAKYGSYTEPATVSVSEDGVHFVDFPCHLGTQNYPGCAGVRAVLANPDINDIDPTDPEKAGGDAFDLGDIGLTSARFIRIRDEGMTFGPAGGGMRGFDLDAVAVVNGKIPP